MFTKLSMNFVFPTGDGSGATIVCASFLFALTDATNRLQLKEHAAIHYHREEWHQYFLHQARLLHNDAQFDAIGTLNLDYS